MWACIAKIDKVSEELTLRYPHEEPCVDLHHNQAPENHIQATLVLASLTIR